MNLPTLIPWLGIAITLIAIVTYLLKKPEKAADIWQGAAAVATICALLAAGWIYLIEHKDRARFELKVSATVIPGEAAGKETRSVLVQVKAQVANSGTRPAEAECTNLDIAAVNLSGAARAPEEYHFPSLLHDVYHGKDWERCWNGPLTGNGGRSTSGYVWDATSLEPNGSDVLFYELAVPCELRAVRVLVKIPRTGDATLNMDEYKLLVPILDVCSGKVSQSVFT